MPLSFLYKPERTANAGVQRRMPDWSTPIANEFIRLAKADGGRALTQMQLQKLVYIAHGWNLAINGEPLTYDDPQAWDYGPVYRGLRRALRDYGSQPVTKEISNSDYAAGAFANDPEAPARANLSPAERAVVERVYRDYGKFHAFRLSALTHQPGTPWSTVYDGGRGRFDDISSDMIRGHFVELARGRQPAPHA